MGIMDFIKKNNQEDNYDDDYYNEFDDYAGTEDEQMNTQGAAPVQPQPAPAAPYSAPYNPGISLSGSALAMMVVKPEHFDSAPQIADHLLNNCTVVLNLENTNKETARRLIDFLSGVAYSIDGSLKKISSHVYVITPHNVDVSDSSVNSQKAEAAPAVDEAPAAEEADEFGRF